APGRGWIQRCARGRLDRAPRHRRTCQTIYRRFRWISVADGLAAGRSGVRSRSDGGRLRGQRRRGAGGDEQPLAVEPQLVDALADVVEGAVGGGLAGQGRERPRVPAPGELLDGGDVDGAVVEVLLDLREVLGQEAPVRPDGVAAQRD